MDLFVLYLVLLYKAAHIRICQQPTVLCLQRDGLYSIRVVDRDSWIFNCVRVCEKDLRVSQKTKFDDLADWRSAIKAD